MSRATKKHAAAFGTLTATEARDVLAILARVRWDWRRKLQEGDEAELRKWVEQIGPERAARIMAACTDAGGQRGQSFKPETSLLKEMAHLKLLQPTRTDHAIAVEVAGKSRIRRGSTESLRSKLERDFKAYRTLWMALVSRETFPPTSEEIARDRRKSKNEARALCRLIELIWSP